jgi:AcrR family transcriptional regulator
MRTALIENIEKSEGRTNVHGDETRRAIVLAAIRVIAENGVAGASLRAINVAAGSKNSSAAHYHFGTKLAMIEAALALVWSEVAPGQQLGLDALEAQVAEGKSLTARAVLEAVYDPYFALLERPEFGLTTAKFVSRLLVESDADIQALLNQTVATQMLRVLMLVSQALPEIPAEVLATRLFISVTNVIHGSGDLAALGNSPLGDLYGGNTQIFARHLFDYLAGAVSAPTVGTS